MTKFIIRFALPAAVIAALVASPARSEEVSVKIGNFTFAPQQVTVKAGTIVTWVNDDDIPHTVVSMPNVRSKPLDSGDKFSFTFTTPGSYKYFCSLHPHMTGTIVVQTATGDNAPK
jgi:plastocyanin